MNLKLFVLEVVQGTDKSLLLELWPRAERSVLWLAFHPTVGGFSLFKDFVFIL